MRRRAGRLPLRSSIRAVRVRHSGHLFTKRNCDAICPDSSSMKATSASTSRAAQSARTSHATSPRDGPKRGYRLSHTVREVTRGTPARLWTITHGTIFIPEGTAIKTNRTNPCRRRRGFARANGQPSSHLPRARRPHRLSRSAHSPSASQLETTPDKLGATRSLTNTRTPHQRRGASHREIVIEVTGFASGISISIPTTPGSSPLSLFKHDVHATSFDAEPLFRPFADGNTSRMCLMSRSQISDKQQPQASSRYGPAEMQ